MHKLLYEELIKIEAFLWEKYSHRQIAKKLWRSNRTISNKIRKYSTNWIYNAKLAWQERKTKRSLINILNNRIEVWSELEQFILEKIQEYWSPEQITGRRKLETWEKLSKDTIYRFIYYHYPEYVKKYFRRKWKKYKKSWYNSVKIHNRVSIHERPKEVEKRKKLWHWEWDTIIWKNHKQWILTYVERVSWYLCAGKLDKRTASNVTEKSYELFSVIPDIIRKTLTYDNWLEFAEHYIIAVICKMKTYFADPYRSQQRWTNENTNWLIREFFPRWMDLSKLKQGELDKIIDLINNRPRKRLNYLTPIEFLNKKGVYFRTRI